MEDEPTDPVLVAPLHRTTWRFYVVCGALLAIVLLGAYGYWTQLNMGLAATGLNDKISWGMYISNFVFFIGISHAGTLISAILRVTKAEWRRPITRMAESITVIAIAIAATFPLIDLGRPDRFANIFLYGRIESAILWDFLSIATYFTGSILYLSLPMIPDAAILRARSVPNDVYTTDKLPKTGSGKIMRRVIRALASVPGRFRSFVYGLLSKHWTGTPRQRRALERAIGIMAIVIIPVAVSVHTVVSWIFGMTLRVGWHSAIYGPYFVVGAIFSGIATLIVAMAVFRRVYHLEKYITVQHFRNLAYLLLVLDIAIIYFTLSEYLTAAYGGEEADVAWLSALSVGPYAALFWGMVVTGFIVPAFLIGIRRTRTVGGIVAAAVLIDVAMWVERFLIVVPSMATPQVPFDWGVYHPTWVEWSITAASFAGFALLYAVFSKVFPIVSMWEVRENPEPESTPAKVEKEVTG